MGFTGTLVHCDGRWQRDTGTGPALTVHVTNSDIAAVDYRPAPPDRGRFYLGFQPRDYYENPVASDPVDAAAEVAGLVGWAALALGHRLDAREVLPLLAADGTEDPLADFVEDTLVELLELLGLPLPGQLVGGLPGDHPETVVSPRR